MAEWVKGGLRKIARKSKDIRERLEKETSGTISSGGGYTSLWNGGKGKREGTSRVHKNARVSQSTFALLTSRGCSLTNEQKASGIKESGGEMGLRKSGDPRREEKNNQQRLIPEVN